MQILCNAVAVRVEHISISHWETGKAKVCGEAQARIPVLSVIFKLRATAKKILFALKAVVLLRLISMGKPEHWKRICLWTCPFFISLEIPNLNASSDLLSENSQGR